MKKSRRNLLVMLGVVAALAAGALAEQVRQQRFGPRTFLSIETAGLKRIERTCTGCAKLVMQKRQGYWEIVEPYVAKADEDQVARLVDIARAPVRHLLDANTVDPEQSGLAHPDASLVLGEKRIDFGAAMPGQDRYAKSGERIALVQDRFTALLTSPPETFVDPRPLAGNTATNATSVNSTPEHIAAFSTARAARVVKAPAVIGGHFVQVQLANGRHMRFHYEFTDDGGVLLLRRGDPYAYRLGPEEAAKIGMTAR